MSPVKMNLSGIENQYYQAALKSISEISLNLMAVKVESQPDSFINWCKQLHQICRHDVNRELLDEAQFKPLKKLESTLEAAVSISQLRMVKLVPWQLLKTFLEDNSQLQSLTERLSLLTYTKSLKETCLSELSEEDRLTIAGKHTAKHDPAAYAFDVEWFASTKSNKAFHQLLLGHPALFSEALSEIPLSGDVTSEQYFAFVKKYKAIFGQFAPEDKPPLTAATRLLALRRPDHFIAMSSAKLDLYSQGFGITKLNNQSFDDYWHEIISTLTQCLWWKSEQPEQEEELLLWQNRMILVDLFLFADPEQASRSNYIKLRDKPKTQRSTSTRAVKRTKESAEQLVDRALEDPTLPGFLLGMRDSLVKSVQGGKTVEQAISLMRSIFG